MGDLNAPISTPIFPGPIQRATVSSWVMDAVCSGCADEAGVRSGNAWGVDYRDGSGRREAYLPAAPCRPGFGPESLQPGASPRNVRGFSTTKRLLAAPPF